MTSGQMVIDGRFELLDRLGSGGMGTVWRARDLALEREVALKEVRLAGSDAQHDPDVARMLRERVLREARALARLDHPNVVTIHHIVDSPEMPHPWLVMELVRGRSLQDRLADGPLPPAEVARIGRGVLAALVAAHAAGICHRDVKPANVLLRTDGSPVLTDFGIAVLEEASRVTVTGGLVGSPEYIAPERLHGQEGNPASDLWSLGLLMYASVEGHNPFRRNTTAATLAAVIAAQIPPPVQAGPLAPALQALLVPDPARRPAPAHLDQMLAHAAGQAPTAAVPAPRPMPPSPRGGMLTNPNPYAPGTFPGAMPPLPPKRRSGGLAVFVTVTFVLGMVAAILTTVVVAVPKLLDAVIPDGDSAQEGVGTIRSSEGAGEPSSSDGGGSGSGVPESQSLLTPASIRKMIGLFEKASGSKQFAEMTVYEDHASADAPVKGRRSAFDEYTYEPGADAAVRKGPSIAITTGDAKVSLRSFKWDALPQLMKRANKTLNVAKPTSRYIIVRAAWAFSNDQPVMMIYLADEYDGGYLAVNLKGKVISTVPAD